LSVLVLGLAVQPVVLGGFGPLPCVLWPRADLLLPAPPFATTTLVIPPSAFPFQLWVQSVGLLGGGGLTVSDAFAVFGN
jgi:hypothetical protein